MALPASPETRTLDSLRQRLVTLSNTIASLKHSLEVSDPLPPWPSIQSSANLLSHNLKGLLTQLQSNQAFLAAAHVYPLPNFPASQQGILQQLLRKKLEPSAEEWVDESREWAARLDGNDVLRKDGEDGTEGGEVRMVDAEELAPLSMDELTGLWDWAPRESNSIARKIDWGGEFTNEEKAMGVDDVAAGLGLKRNLAAGVGDKEDDEEEGSEEEFEDEEVEDSIEGSASIVGPDVRKRPTGGRGGGAFQRRTAVEERIVEMEKPMLPLEDIFRFMSTGALPRKATALGAGRGAA